MKRWIVRTAVTLAVLGLTAILGGAAWAWLQLRGSLPALDGQQALTGLSAPVRVARDALGVPTIAGATRQDVARATGWLHAQDRFFQMDLARRRAAGELSAVVGPAALAIDRDIRIHRFRSVAARAVSLLAAEDAAVLAAYVGGVNAGLQALTSPPFEYRLLRQRPAPWTAEDSLLVVLSMFVTLQDDDGTYESSLGTMHDLLPQVVAAFLAPAGTEWDAPISGDAFAVPPIPGPEVYDLRARRLARPPAGPAGISAAPAAEGAAPEAAAARGAAARKAAAEAAAGTWARRVSRGEPLAGHVLDWAALLGVDERGDGAIGSNNWAVDGRLGAGGGAIVANDMHLGIRVPNTWYRARFEWPDPQGGETHALTGVTLPGVPAMVVGSNGSVAWGFTNTYADWSDIVLLETDPADRDRYRTPEGWARIEYVDETVEVAGAAPERLRVGTTIWGPLLPDDYRGRRRAYRWVAHAADRLAGAVAPLEQARTVDEAFDAANGLGTPGQNFVVADRDGRIGWTVYGAIPRRVGLDGSLPSSWADGSRGWSGWLDDREYPRVMDPASGRLWTANARVVDGPMLALLGDGSYEVGSRALAIRDRLLAREHFTPADMLSIQLDARAVFLDRWHDLLVHTLDDEAIAAGTRRRELRDLVTGQWTGNASPDSAAYRLVRTFRDEVSAMVFDFVLVECREADAAFDYTAVRRREGPLWALVTERPLHLLDPRFESWHALLLAAADRAVASALGEDAAESGERLADRVWSEMNEGVFRHPLSGAVPVFGRWLDMPAAALPGDLYTPRMHWRGQGASERMVVSPGREEEGLLHMPTGQSGHPLSPFYANSHPAWVAGEPTPFLPGPALHTLTLTP
ncbi:MAG: penicillin acylase family protein [Acidobacteria bacterium]|nr:penicillin acylase family protein [Acidobacteriota bacterium]